MEYKLTHIIRKINNSNFKSSVRYKQKKEFTSGDTRQAKAILDSFKFKKLEKKKKTEEPLEGAEVKAADLSDMPRLEGNEEAVKDVNN